MATKNQSDSWRLDIHVIQNLIRTGGQGTHRDKTNKNWPTIIFFLLPVLRFLLLWLGCFWTTWITIWKTPCIQQVIHGLTPEKEKDIILYIWVLKENESSILFWFQVLYYIHFHVKELALIIACLKELTTKYWDKKTYLKEVAKSKQI